MKVLFLDSVTGIVMEISVIDRWCNLFSEGVSVSKESEEYNGRKAV